MRIVQVKVKTKDAVAECKVHGGSRSNCCISDIIPTGELKQLRDYINKAYRERLKNDNNRKK